MVRAVMMFIAEDGEQFETQAEAEAHEASTVRAEALTLELYDNTSLAYYECKEVAKYLARTYELIKRDE